MTDFYAGSILQLRMFRKNPGYLLLFLAVPFFSLIFLSITGNDQNTTVLSRAILAPGIMGLWMIAVALADMIIILERGYGTLEFIVAAPAVLSRIIAGRILTVTILGLVTILEAIVLARIAFGHSIQIFHPLVFAIALAIDAFATAGTAIALTGFFLAFRPASRYVNALGYPFYILGGVILPISYLPAWIRPLSYVVYLHWTSSMIYASVVRAPVQDLAGSIAIAVVIACVSYVSGDLLLRKVIRRLRVTGTVGLA
jgi:ABC-2 type transport system permease protein